jgi:formylglycine-generating enzyme required for sulfatase activity
MRGTDLSRLFEIHHKGAISRFGESELPLAIGSSADTHIYLPEVMAIEAYIGDSKGFLFLQPAETKTPKFHNGQQVEASSWIKSGDTTRIGSFLLHFRISGDLVEIHVGEVDDKKVLMPPDSPHPDAGGVNEVLPRIAKDINAGRWRKKISLMAIGFLLLLLLAASFVLTARPLEVAVSPEPDTLSISGFPPVIKFGTHFLGLKGEYTVKASKAGYQQLVEPVIISGNEANRFAFTLEKQPGRIDFNTTPVAGALVFVDGQNIGVTPLLNVQVSAGDHRVRIVREQYLEQEQLVEIEGLGQRQQFDFVLAPAWAAVTLNTEPAGASVIIGDREYGYTPITFELLGGSHEIVLQKQDFIPHVMKLDVEAGTSFSADTVVLKLAPALLELTSKPSGATITVDSLYKGSTPLTVEMTANKEHAFVLNLPGYKEFRKKIILGPGQTQNLGLSLQPEFGIIFLTAEPSDAELYIDGELHGKAAGRLQMTVREHTLEVRAKGYKSETFTVTPQKSYSRQIDIRLMPAGHVKQSVELPDKIKTGSSQELVLLKGPVSFQMGSSRGEQGRRSNEYQHQVKISHAFYLGSKEVTNAEFRLFNPNHFSGAFARRTLDNDTQPAVNVSWEDAARYMNWLSEKDGLNPFYREENGKMIPVKPFTTGYRLPFETEWAYATRLAGRQKMARYGWQGTFPPREKSGNYADESARAILPVIIRGYNDMFDVAAPVASFPVNPGGFYDLDGNVSEWCHDYYTPYTPLGDEVEADPTGPESGTHHVVRGASWRDGSITEIRLSYRGYSRKKSDDLGFRIARFTQ